MSSDRQNEEQIFKAALKIDSGTERLAFIHQACGEDRTLLVRIKALLGAHAQADDFLENPGTDSNLTLEQPCAIGPGTMIDRYKLLENIGEGGMATVYMAEQKQPIHRRVALKLIKPGMDTQQVIARFEAERQALAMMDHPNISKVLDAGTTETGRPYFVMELVKGISITEFCDKNNLNTQERLTLFISVCQAVHHAHQKGIIHRDIKPSNVLVTLHDGVPVPKVIDFGIAKAMNQQLTEKTLFTRFAQMIGTPEYMSPEQAEMSGLDIDIRTDVFSLGVLLYELLTGTTPFDSEYLLSKGYAEIQRIICQEEPSKPSTKISTLGKAATDIAKSRHTSPDGLLKLIRSDLDWITMKTLEKDRNRRYDSVSELAADIKRHLNQEPVLAGPPSALYRIRKFVQRRKTLVAATSVVLVAIVMALVFSTLMYFQAERALRRESAARAETQLVSDFLTDDLLASVYPENAKSPEVTVRYFLDTASKNIEKKLAGSPLSEARIRETIGLAYSKLGDYRLADPQIKRALDIRQRQLREDDPATLTSLGHLGEIYSKQGRYNEAETLLQEAMAGRIRVLGEKHPDTLESMCTLGWEYVYKKVDGRFNKSEELFDRALQIGTNELGEENLIVLDAMNGLAFYYTLAYRFAEAESLSQKGLDICTRVCGKEHEQTVEFMGMIVWIHGLRSFNESDVTLAQEALEISLKVFGEKNICTVLSLSNLGWLYMKQGLYDEALPLLVKSVDLCKYVLHPSHPESLYLMNRLVTLYYTRHQDKEADNLLAWMVDESETAHGTNYPHTRGYRSRLVQRSLSLETLGMNQCGAGQYEEALETFVHLLGLCRVVVSTSSLLSEAYIAMCQYQLGHLIEARTSLDQVRQRYAQGEGAFMEEHLYNTEKLFAENKSPTLQCWQFIEMGRLDEALDTLETMPVSPEDDLDSIRKALARAYCSRARNLETDGNYQEARIACEAAIRIDPNYIFTLNQIAWALATCSESSRQDTVKSLELARRACQLTNNENPAYLKTLAAAYAATGDFTSAVQQQTSAIELLPQEDRPRLQTQYRQLLQQYESNQPYHRQPAHSLEAYWQFDPVTSGTIPGRPGSGFHGKLIGDARIIEDSARGHALKCEGQDYLDCGNDLAYDIVGSLTVAAWVKVATLEPRINCIVTKGDSAWRLQCSSKGIMEFACNELHVPDTIWCNVTGQQSINDSQWHHVVGVYDSRRLCLYLDGELEAETPASGVIGTSDYHVYIGANAEIAGRNWHGLIDDVRIYNYGFSQMEVQALYAGKAAEQLK